MPAASIFYFMGGVVRDGKGLALCHTAPCTHSAAMVCCAACISLCFLSSYRNPALPRIADLHTPQERVLQGSADGFLGSGGHGGTLYAVVEFILSPPALKQWFPGSRQLPPLLTAPGVIAPRSRICWLWGWAWIYHRINLWVVTGGCRSCCCWVFDLSRGSCVSCSGRRWNWRNLSPCLRWTHTWNLSPHKPVAKWLLNWGFHSQGLRSNSSAFKYEVLSFFSCLKIEENMYLCNHVGFASRYLSSRNISSRKRFGI